VYWVTFLLHSFLPILQIIFNPVLASASNSFSFPLTSLPFLEDGDSGDSVLKVLGGMVMSCYAKYWIYVCGGMFIVVSFAGKLVAYKIIYMLLFLLCLCLYQVGTNTVTSISGIF